MRIHYLFTGAAPGLPLQQGVRPGPQYSAPWLPSFHIRGIRLPHISSLRSTLGQGGRIFMKVL